MATAPLPPWRRFWPWVRWTVAVLLLGAVVLWLEPLLFADAPTRPTTWGGWVRGLVGFGLLSLLLGALDRAFLRHLAPERPASVVPKRSRSDRPAA